MTTRSFFLERSIWGALAAAGGCVVAWIDLSATDVQSTLLLYMVLAFALTLPGRAPIWLVAVASGAGLPMLRAFSLHQFNPAYFVAVIPALIGAAGGRVAGRLLDRAVSRLTEPQAADGQPWARRPLSRRALLAVALTAMAAAGLPVVQAVLRDHRAAGWLAIVWQIMTLLAWIAFTPLLLDARWPARIAARSGMVGAASSPSPIVVASHAVLILVLALIHALGIVAISSLLRVPIEPGWRELVTRALMVYLPLDALAYLGILALGAASDVERLRRDAAQRERALHAEMLDSRLDALRARLNPHFLFNALNGADVLARAGKAAETSRMLAGVTALLRYVLDERRATVALGDELAFARHYLEVQQIRLGDRLHYVVDAPPALERSAAVPQLLLQPIVENAVEHGIGATLEGGGVRIAAARDGESLRLTVEDDGPGPAATVPNQSRGIGLANTRERLARLFDGRATLTLEPRAPRGTRVIICIPYHPYQETASPDGRDPR